MADFLQTLIIAVTLGSLYALIALGYTMVYGILKLINFAHSDIVVLGAWISVTIATFLLPHLGIYVAEAPWWAAIPVLLLSMLICGGIGFVIERLAYKPIRKAPRLNALITAIGVSLFLQNTGQLQFSVLKSKLTDVASGKVTERVDAKHIKLGQTLKLDPAGTFTLKFNEPGKTDFLERKLTLKPGIYAAGSVIELDPGLPARFATGEFTLVRASMPLDLPFGARPERMPPGLVPDDSTATSPGVLINKQFVSKITTPDGRTVDIQKPVRITIVDVLIVGTAGLLMVLLQGLVYHTRIGIAMRAVSFNMDTAALMGIPVDRIISITFVTGAFLAAAAGFLYAMKYGQIQQPAHWSWVLLGLKAFVAAVIGGIGNIRGAAIGGFLIAFIEQFGAYGGQLAGWDQASALTDVFVFVLLILVLLVKPTGIFGSTVREKV